MDRRDFIKTTIVTGITLAIPGNASFIYQSAGAAEKTDSLSLTPNTAGDNQSGH